MIYSENKASEFRCCGPEGCGQAFDNRYEGPPTVRHCIGAKCAAWIWSDAETEEVITYRHNEETARRLGPDGDGWTLIGAATANSLTEGAWSAVWRRPNPARQGYCGLTRR